MPPRKRKAPASGGPAVKSAKASSVAIKSDDSVQLDGQYQWQWEEKPGSWLIFDDKIQISLSEAFNDKEDEYHVDDETVVSFLKPVRKTKKTGYQKRVRVGKKDKDCDNQVMIWSWEDGRKKRHYYSVSSVAQLENQPTAASMEVYSEGKLYNVDVKNKLHIPKFAMYREESDAKPEPPKPSSSKSKDAPASKGKIVKVESKPEEKVVEKTITVKGKAPVDNEYPSSSSVHVFYDDKDIWDCMLNQTNLQNNNNKYYLIQLLKSDTSTSYTVWMRWGRVGKKGQTSEFPCGPDLNEAKSLFVKKFHDKTKNDWYSRATFSKVAGKYDLLEMDYDTGGQVDEVDTSKVAKKVDVPDSTLDEQVQDLIRLICDIKAMEEAVVEMKYDAKKAPLGKLTKSQIKQGYSALKQIEQLLEKKDLGPKLTEACNAFYTRIPHDFGMKPPERITTLALLQNKMSLLEALGDIEIAVNVLKAGDQSINPVDRHYLSLECNLQPMNKSHEMYEILANYLQSTHASTHSQYSMQLLDIFSCDKDEGEASTVGNKMLLWHGSRLTNWVGILAKGLRIAPPEAPVTGYMFGKGVYFADCSSKSANYCFPTKTKNVGLLLLCEVALGKSRELLASDYYANKLPKGMHSVKGCGKNHPNPASKITKDGVNIPTGNLVDSGVNNPSGYTLQYNEYIVYNTNQIKMKYLFKVKFNFKY